MHQGAELNLAYGHSWVLRDEFLATIVVYLLNLGCAIWLLDSDGTTRWAAFWCAARRRSAASSRRSRWSRCPTSRCRPASTTSTGTRCASCSGSATSRCSPSASCSGRCSRTSRTRPAAYPLTRRTPRRRTDSARTNSRRLPPPSSARPEDGGLCVAPALVSAPDVTPAAIDTRAAVPYLHNDRRHAMADSSTTATARCRSSSTRRASPIASAS